MTDMKEIEKAIDEFEQASRSIMNCLENKANISVFYKAVEERQFKRAHLLELIKEVKHERLKDISVL